MKPETLIELKNVKKYYRMGDAVVKALDGISLTVEKGEFLAIMGPSGSGKSTMMNMIGALDMPDSGEVILNGTNIAHLSESKLALLRGQEIGFIFQQFNLIPSLSALENVMLPMIFQSVPADERIKRGKQLLELTELGERVHHKPTELSGGQQQRVAISRSLANNPNMILADEPTGSLDSKTGVNVIEFLKKLNQEQGKTIVMVTHDENVAKHAQRVIKLKDGKTV